MLLMLHNYWPLLSLKTLLDFLSPPPTFVEWVEQSVYSFNEMTKLLHEVSLFLFLTILRWAGCSFTIPSRWQAVTVVRSATNLKYVPSFNSVGQHVRGVKGAAFDCLAHTPDTCELNHTVYSTNLADISPFDVS